MEFAVRYPFWKSLGKTFESGGQSRQRAYLWHVTIEKWRAIAARGMPLA
jgi:hypothetical protein